MTPALELANDILRMRDRGNELLQKNMALTTALHLAVATLDSVRGDINPERGYAEELEAEVQQTLNSLRAVLSFMEAP
jgi:hypothetical protein